MDAGGWYASNTEATLVVRAEGSSIKALDRLVKNIETALGAAGLNWQAECKDLKARVASARKALQAWLVGKVIPTFLTSAASGANYERYNIPAA